VIDTAVHGAQIHVSLETPELLVAVEAALAEAGFTVSQTELIQPSLEDVFIHMVEKSRLEANHGAPENDQGA
jgi:hypothetical protein